MDLNETKVQVKRSSKKRNLKQIHSCNTYNYKKENDGASYFALNDSREARVTDV